MKRKRLVIWALVALFVFGVAIPAGIAYAARPSEVIADLSTTLSEGIGYPYQRSTFWDQVNESQFSFFVENYFLKFNSSDDGETWNTTGWKYSACSGSKNFSIYYDQDYAHITYVNSSLLGASAVWYGMVDPLETLNVSPLASPEVIAHATVGARVLEPMVMVDADKNYVMIVWTQDLPTGPPVLPRYTVWAAVGNYNTSGHWEQLIEPTDELTGPNNSRYISATVRYDDDDSIYVIHAENKSIVPTAHKDLWYLVGNNFNGTSGAFEADQWIMDAVTPELELYEGYYYSTASIWAKPEIQTESVHIVYTQNATLLTPTLFNTTHQWADFQGEDWGVHTRNLTVGGQVVIEPVLARFNDSALKLLYADHTGEVGYMRHRNFNTVALTWNNSSLLRRVDWEADDIQMGWNASSPLGYNWLNLTGPGAYTLYYDWFGDQGGGEVTPTDYGADLLQAVLPLLMALIALLAVLVVGIRLQYEPKVTIIVGMMAAALVGAIAFLVVQQIVGGL